ncbi:MotA/TolQ/ExbB proton channel family protein [Novosphingobium nitrogenifigens]|nr:MotA/TolQ/ExbB proton channel family protein [Novosphingobium nitrogenifigens]
MNALFAARPAMAWWNSDWAYRQSITIDTGANGAHLQDRAFDVPVIVRLHTGNFAFDSVKPDGSDLRVVTEDDKTPLPFAIERFAKDSGIAIIRVLVPVLEPGHPTHLWLYYGNGKADAASDRSTVRDRLALMAFDFESLENGLKDRTSYGNSPTTSAIKAAPGGVIGDAGQFTATDTVSIAASPSLAVSKAGGAALSFWIHANPGGAGSIIAIGDPAAPALAAQVGADGAVIVHLHGVDLSTGPLSANAWHHVAVSINANTVILYLDGQEKVRANATDILPFGGAVTLGANGALAGFSGLLDDLEFDKTARAADWIRAGAMAARPESHVVALGALEQKSQASAYFSMLGGIASMVSLDGWVIIGFTLILGFIAGEVSLTKVVQLRRIAAGNARFIGATGTATAPDPTAFFAQSSFARIEATAQKLSAVREEDGSVPEGQIELVRSAVARTQIDEAAALNKGLVMLTLTISGAPFLGLLGTVIGVMITFAAIAASGDVNVNTIAPGISAALACTVVGLVVAIPTVFAYNILMARIREQLTAMDVYGEDAVTRAALVLRQAARTGSAAHAV